MAQFFLNLSMAMCIRSNYAASGKKKKFKKMKSKRNRLISISELNY